MTGSGVSLRCIGSGDAFGSGGRLNSCYHLRAGQNGLLIDCGCSSLIGLQRNGLKPGDIDTVVVSHLHGDHFGGIPFLLLEGKYASRRRRPLTLIGPEGLRRQVEAALNALYPGTLDDGFGFRIDYLVLQPDRVCQVDPFRIAAWPVKHGRSEQVYGLRIEVGGRVVSYTGDTEWTENLIPLADESDLLIAECFGYDQAIPSHLDHRTLVSKRSRLNSRRIVLTHMGPEVLARLDRLEFDVLNDGGVLDL